MNKEELNTTNKLTFNNFFYPLLFLVSTIIIEIGTNIALGFNLFPTYFLLDFFIMLLFASVLFLTSNKIAQLVLTIIILVVQSMISYVNVTLYSIYGDLFSFDMLVLGAEAFSVFDPSFIKWGFLAFLLIVLATVITIMSVFLKHKISYKLKSKTALIVLSIFLGSQTAGIGGYFIQLACLNDNNNTVYAEYFENDKKLYDQLFIKSEALKRFGSYPFYFQNLINLTFNDFNDINYEEVKSYVSTNPVYETNEKTGILKDNNLIVIMCESLEWFAVNPILTPTLDDIFNNGITLTNYISKSKTNYSEMDVILGSVPSDNSFTNSWHGSNSSLLDNNLAFSLPNKLKNAGYETTKFFHDNSGSFYGREKTHKTFGFDEVITLEDMNIEDKAEGLIGHNSNYTKDSDMIKSCINQIAPTNQKFFSFLTTITSHGPYNESKKLTEYYKILDNGGLEEFKTWLANYADFVYPEDDEKYETYLRNYLATIMDLDRGVEYLLNYLSENNILDNTTLVIFSDHNAYYQDLSYKMRNMEKSEYDNPQLYKVPATIFNSTLEPELISDFTNPYNLLPTILDLLGVKYNNNMYMGYSIFNNNFSDSIFVSQIGGIMTDKIYSENNVDLISKFEISNEDAQKFKENTLKFYIKQEKMNLVYNSNIFEKYPELIEYI